MIHLENVSSGMTLSDGSYTIVATNPDLASSEVSFTIRTVGPAILAGGAPVKATQWYASGVQITFADEVQNIAEVLIEDRYGNVVVDSNDAGEVLAAYTLAPDISRNVYYIRVIDTMGRVSGATIKVRG